MAKLGVNIDHVATVRQARRAHEPDPVWAAALAELGGADGITVHLREDRRHIQDRDVRVLRETVSVKLNLEMACAAPIVALAVDVRPDLATIVPERREEVTTEGGLDVCGGQAAIAAVIEQLHTAGIEVSLFIDPDPRQIEASQRAGADAVELHTGAYANAGPAARDEQLRILADAAALVHERQMELHAGHGLTYQNVRPVARLPGMGDLNIGHSIVARAVFVGLTQAVREMKSLIGPA